LQKQFAADLRRRTQIRRNRQNCRRLPKIAGIEIQIIESHKKSPESSCSIPAMFGNQWQFWQLL
jgi:hypothetical protein